MKIIPSQNYVLMSKLEDIEISPGGILISSKRMKDYEKASVLKCGPDVIDIKPGAIVYYLALAEQSVKLGNETLILVSEENILAEETD